MKETTWVRAIVARGIGMRDTTRMAAQAGIVPVRRTLLRLNWASPTIPLLTYVRRWAFPDSLVGRRVTA